MYVKKYLCHLRVFEIMLTLISSDACVFFHMLCFIIKLKQINKSEKKNKIVELLVTFDQSKIC